MKRKVFLISFVIIIALVIVALILMRISKDNNFIMYVDEISFASDSVILKGKIIKGEVNKGDTLEIINNDVKEVKINDIEVDGKKVETATTDQKAFLNIGNPKNGSYKRGMVIASKGLVKRTKKLELKITLYDDFEGMVQDSSVLVFKIGPENYAGIVEMKDSLVATQTGTIKVLLDDMAPVYKGGEVFVKLDGKTEIGRGKITGIN